MSVYPTGDGYLHPTIKALLANGSTGGGEEGTPVDLSGYVTTTALTTALSNTVSTEALATALGTVAHTGQNMLDADKTMTDTDWNTFMNFASISNRTVTVVPPSSAGKWVLIGNMATGNVTVNFNAGTSVVYGKGIDGQVQYGTLSSVTLPIGQMMLVFSVGVGQPNYYWILVY